MNMGARFPFVFGHAYAGWWEKYGAAHPEYFALQPNGSRTQHPPRERLCESEPRLWEQVAANAIAAFDADPSLRMFSICENDGGTDKFCSCPRCLAMDPPNAPKLTGRKARQNQTNGESTVSLSDRVFTFYNEVARRVKEKYPDRYLGVYAYSIYALPPVKLKTLEDNLIVSVVSDDFDKVKDWSSLAPKMFVRPNTLWDGRAFGMVRNDARRLGRLVQESATHHVMGMDWDGMVGNWATQGLDYYVVARMMWDPSQDLEALIDDYLVNAYGKASAPAVKQYYDNLEELTAGLVNDATYEGRKVNPERLLVHYTPERLAELEKSLNAARDASADGSPERQRIDLVRLGLEYSKRVCGLFSSISASHDRSAYDTEWKSEAPFFAELAKNRWFGTAQNLTNLTPALKSLARRERKSGK